MKARGKVGTCPLCGGTKQPGTTTFTVELGFGVVIIRHVPATICAQCGTDWITDDVAVRLEALVDDARKKRLQVEVLSLA
jgi:YgiT-type zinc finger domain-containing protein